MEGHVARVLTDIESRLKRDEAEAQEAERVRNGKAESAAAAKSATENIVCQLREDLRLAMETLSLLEENIGPGSPFLPISTQTHTHLNVPAHHDTHLTMTTHRVSPLHENLGAAQQSCFDTVILVYAGSVLKDLHLTRCCGTDTRANIPVGSTLVPRS